MAYRRQFQGVVVSTRMRDTVVVRVDRKKMHPIYKKQYKVSKRYSVHSTDPSIQEGDTVQFEECRPISKTKRWRLLGKV